jgi:hypothetical protein
MNVGRRKEGMDARMKTSVESLPCSFDIVSPAPRQARNDWTGHIARYGLNSLKVAIRGNRESCLNDVHTQAVELLRHAQLFVRSHAAARRLFAVP